MYYNQYPYQQMYQGAQPGVPGGYQYPQQPQVIPNQNPPMTQLLTPEEMAKMKNGAKNEVNFSLTEQQFFQSICTHKDCNGAMALTKISPDGRVRCNECLAEFNLMDPSTSPDDINKICGDFYDFFQSAKTFYPNPPKALRDFYTISGFIPKSVQFWDVGTKAFRSMFNNVIGNDIRQNPDQVGFGILNSALGAGAMGGIFPGMYYGGVPQQQPMMYGQPAAPQPTMNGYDAQPTMQPQAVYPQQYPQPYPQGYPAPQNNIGVPGAVNPYMQQQPLQGNPIGYPVQPQQQQYMPQGQMMQQPQATANVSVPVMPGPAAPVQQQQAQNQQPPVQQQAVIKQPENPNMKDNKANVSKKFPNA